MKLKGLWEVCYTTHGESCHLGFEHVGSQLKNFRHIKLGNSFDTPIAYATTLVPFHKDFSPSGERLEYHKLAHEL